MRILWNISRPSLDHHQDLPVFDRRFVLDEDARDLAGDGRRDRVHGFHRLDEKQRLALCDHVAELDKRPGARLGRGLALPIPPHFENYARAVERMGGFGRLFANTLVLTLVSVLLVFQRTGVNMTMITSRPNPKAELEYYFFTDIDGHASDPAIAKAIEEVRGHCRTLRVLGSYPKSTQVMAD